MPRPDIDVFIDGMFRETMRDDKNVVDMYNVQPGPHTIVLLALNRSREIINRKEIHVEVVAPPEAQATRPAPRESPAARPGPAGPRVRAAAGSPGRRAAAEDENGRSPDRSRRSGAGARKVSP